MFRFWYRFIPDHLSLINRDEADLAYERIRTQIQAFMGAVFEDMCKQYLWRQNIAGRTPVPFTEAGRWWGSDPGRREACEIDIVADDRRDAIFAECKWTNEPVGPDLLTRLLEKSALFRQYGNKYYYLFAKNGFTDALAAEAERRRDVRLVGFGDF
jgi:AAA+ ATPase superfamily predicted ATPase